MARTTRCSYYLVQADSVAGELGAVGAVLPTARFQMMSVLCGNGFEGR